MFDDMMSDPVAFGFTNIKDTCYEEIMPNALARSNSVLKMVSSIKPKMKADACEGYLFFDPVHPTGPAHRLMAERTKKLLDDEGVEFGE